MLNGQKESLGYMLDGQKRSLGCMLNGQKERLRYMLDAQKRSFGCMFRVGQNHIYTVFVRYFWQENHQIYGHIRCIYTVLAKPIHVTQAEENEQVQD